MTSAPDWIAGRIAWEAGASLRAVAAQIGVSYESVRQRRHAEGWQRDDAAVAERDAANAARTAAATEQRRLVWLERSAEEADAAGVYAGLARQAVRRALDANDPQMVRAAAVAYGIFIDKAQLLSGGATARTEGGSSIARAHELIDELAARRNAMRAA